MLLYVICIKKLKRKKQLLKNELKITKKNAFYYKIF